LISFEEVYIRVWCDFIGAVRFLSISWSFASLCGVNTLAKCCAKSSDFSLSLLAQGPAVGVVNEDICVWEKYDLDARITLN
jgi:hypothetical protein